MSTIIDQDTKEDVSLFTRYTLTPEEELAGIQFTTSQRMYMQNLIANAAEEKVRMTFDPLNPHIFIQREAELQGTIRTLEGLLLKQQEFLDVLAAEASSDSE